jgi:SAM-dependent methyltransferase
MSGPTAKSIIDLYERHAAHFDEDRSKALFEKPWLDRFSALLLDDAAILDVGCGSGQPIAAHLIGRGYQVTGIDSPSMVTMCAERFP